MTRSLVLLVTLLAAAQSALAAFPDQFYTDGEKIDGWKREAERKTTLWFARLPTETIAYRQALVIVYDREPQNAYYYDLATRKFVGRYSFSEDGYSVLAPEDRSSELDRISQESFPIPGSLPAIEDLFDDFESSQTLLEPPPTKEYPQLQKSEWSTVYFTSERNPIKASVSLDGDTGAYRFESSGQAFEGTLSGIRYASVNGFFEIRGRWTLDDSSGYFAFRIAPDNVNSFSGEWGRSEIEGTWTGSRKHEGR